MALPSRQRALLLATAVVLSAYAGLLFTHRATGVGGSDSSGYANTARDIVSGRIVVPLEGLERLGLPERFAPVFLPLGHDPGPRPGTMVPLYPPGFPIHLALAALVAGWTAGPFLVSPVLAVLVIVLMYFLGREISLSRPLAFAGAAILASCPVFLFQAVQPMSDLAATTWSVAAVLFALRSRKRDAWALAAGIAFGIAVLVRPSDALLLVPLLCALAWRPRVFALFGAGGAPFGLFYGWWNEEAYGSPWRTGYAHIIPGALSPANFVLRFRRYAGWIVRQLSPLLPLGWLASAFCGSLKMRDRVLLISWFASNFLFYCFWGPADDWFFTRYLLPGLPALILGFLVTVRDTLGALPARGREALAGRLPNRALATVAIFLVVLGYETRMNLRHPRPYQAAIEHGTFPEVCQAVAREAGGAQPLVVSMEFSGALRFYRDAIPIRWDAISAADFKLLRARAAERHYPIFAALMPQEIVYARPNVPGDWRFLGNVRRAGLWELVPGP